MTGKITTNANAIPLPQKQELYQQHFPIQQFQQQYIPVQFMPKQVYFPQQPTMIIVAHPAVVPQHMLYAGAPQQLLNYFQGNPHARFQLVPGYQPQPTAQTFIAHNPNVASTIGNYQFVAPSQHNHIPIVHQQQALPAYTQHTQIPVAPTPTVQPMQLGAISHLAQLAAQQYSTSQFPNSIRSIPPIITGLENFTPDQQAAIKAQLNSHLGSGTSLNNLPTNTIAPTAQSNNAAVLPTPSIHNTVLTSTQTHNAIIPSTQGQVNNLSQLTKYSAPIGQNSNDFLPPKEEKHQAESTNNNYTPSLNYRNQFAKG